jgi:hypothetical protein
MAKEVKGKCVSFDTLGLLFEGGQEVHVASEEALCMYRKRHLLVNAAYKNYLQKQF